MSKQQRYRIVDVEAEMRTRGFVAETLLDAIPMTSTVDDFRQDD